MTYLDTHVVAWLYAGEVDRFTASGRERLQEETDLRISPAVLLELQFLTEIGRLRQPVSDVLDFLTQSGVSVCKEPFQDVVRAALPVTWTRDPFDRLIVGQTLAGSGQLLTVDQRIRQNCSAAIW